MNKPVLVIMAAGIGSRYGGGIKQLAGVGPAGEILMDYSLYDAREAGFEKVIFVIRKDLEADFKEVIGRRISRVLDVAYAYQEIDDLPEGFQKPAGRTKPWGTGQAVLACKDRIDSPFAVINADDYYGKEAFVKMYRYLEAAGEETGPLPVAMAGFVLENTLSDHGTVTRGVCQLDARGDLAGVEETKEIGRQEDGRVAGIYQGKKKELDPKSLVSMNFWGYTPAFLDRLEKGFVEFLRQVPKEDGKAEYLLPIFVDELLHRGEAVVTVLPTADPWFGITYAEDKAAVAENFLRLTEAGCYPTPLFG